LHLNAIARNYFAVNYQLYSTCNIFAGLTKPFSNLPTFPDHGQTMVISFQNRCSALTWNKETWSEILVLFSVLGM